MNCKAIQHSDQMVCGLTLDANDPSPPECMCVQPELTNPAPPPATIVFYISLVRCGIAGWGPGPCGTDYSQVTSALRAYKSIDACRIYPVQLPMPTVPTA